MGRTHPSINLAAFAGEHLYYEVQMFICARDVLPRVPQEPFWMSGTKPLMELWESEDGYVWGRDLRTSKYYLSLFLIRPVLHH